jgi:hypothetical protein
MDTPLNFYVYKVDSGNEAKLVMQGSEYSFTHIISLQPGNTLVLTEKIMNLIVQMLNDYIRAPDRKEAIEIMPIEIIFHDKPSIHGFAEFSKEHQYFKKIVGPEMRMPLTKDEMALFLKAFELATS